MLILPLLKHISIDFIVTTVREYQMNQDAQEIMLSPIVAPTSSNADPFVGLNDTLYDIRFKRIINETSGSRHLSSEYLCSTQPHFCCDSDEDYSALSEINTVFKGNL